MSAFLGRHSFEIALLRGRFWYWLGHYDRAIENFQAALRLNWRHGPAAIWLRMAELAKEPLHRSPQPARMRQKVRWDREDS